MLKPPEDVIYERRGKWDYASPLLMRTNQSRSAGILNRKKKLSAAKLTKMNILRVHHGPGATQVDMEL